MCTCLGGAGRAAAQGFSTDSSKPRPWSRVSLFATSSKTTGDDYSAPASTELTTSFTYQLPDVDASGVDYGVDVRYATYSASQRADRVSVYEGFVGARLVGGAVRVRVGHVWLADVGSLGSLAGGVVELRQARSSPEGGRFRAGAFAGAEPNVYEAGYATDIRKVGGYVSYDGAKARRHSIGYVNVRHGALTERSAITFANFLPVGRKLFMYQAGEIDIQPPSGAGRRGLAYFFSSTRLNPIARVELQGTYSRGRSVDARSLGADVLGGRPIAQTAVDGLLYESIGGRVTVEPIARVHVYGGYSRDKNNRDTAPTGRTLVGGYASNVANSGFDVSASDSIMHRSNGSYHSTYVSAGRQVGRAVYVSGDYTTSLSVIRFSRSDGITIETRPHTTRFSGTATVIVGRSVSLLATVERTKDDQFRDLRVLSGITYRIQ
jgi:hypothetical protein